MYHMSIQRRLSLYFYCVHARVYTYMGAHVQIHVPRAEDTFRSRFSEAVNHIFRDSVSHGI